MDTLCRSLSPATNRRESCGTLKRLMSRSSWSPMFLFLAVGRVGQRGDWAAELPRRLRISAPISDWKYYFSALKVLVVCWAGHFYAFHILDYLQIKNYNRRSEPNLESWFQTWRPRSSKLITEYRSLADYKYSCFYHSRLTGSILVLALFFYQLTSYWWRYNITNYHQNRQLRR